MTIDACLARVRAHDDLDLTFLLQSLLKFTGVARRTPNERILAAVAEEVLDLIRRAREDFADWLPLHAEEDVERALAQEVLEALDAGANDPAAPVFPREALRVIASRAGASGHVEFEGTVRGWIQRHEHLETRVGWLLEGTSREVLETLDPLKDAERIFHAVSAAFRVEGRVLELLSINRIVQASSAALFIRSTGESESHAVRRFFDTFTLFALIFEWGEDSLKGRTALGRINQMHGRYTLPNEGMKYILLDAAFTWLDGAARIGHRPLSTKEQRGYFHAFIRLGRGMNIQELSDDWEAMRAWFDDFNRRNAAHHPIKRETFELFVKNSLGDATLPGVDDALLLAARVGMDDLYRQAVGYEAPSEEQVRAVQSVFFTLGSLAEKLPPVPWVRSLQNNPARPKGAKPEELGVHARSANLPVADATKPNGGYPEGQRPVLTARDAERVELPIISWEEIRKHTTAESLWVVIKREVYDLTSWAKLHPGGLDDLLSVAGTDATQAYLASEHSEMADVFRLNFRIGRIG